MPYFAVRIDVTDALPQAVLEGGRVEIAARVFPPAPDRVPDTPTTIVWWTAGPTSATIPQKTSLCTFFHGWAVAKRSRQRGCRWSTGSTGGSEVWR